MDPSSLVETEGKRLAEALQKKIREAGKSYGAVERRLGMGKDTLRHVLSGRVELKVKHVFGILAALDLEPKAFFVEHFGLPVSHEDVADQQRLISLIEASRRLHREGFDLIARILKEKGMLSDDELQFLIWKLRRIDDETSEGLDLP